MAAYVHARLMVCDEHLIFEDTWSTAQKGAPLNEKHQLLLTAAIILLCNPLLPQCMSLTVIDTTVQFIDVICENLSAHFQGNLCNNKLIHVFTGANAIPDEITVGVHIKRHDMTKSHEEANVIIVNQV